MSKTAQRIPFRQSTDRDLNQASALLAKAHSSR